MVTSPGTQPAASLTICFFFLTAWLANATIWFFFAKIMPNATIWFFVCGHHMFFRRSSAKGKRNVPLFFVNILVLDQFGCVTIYFFGWAGWAMSPYNYFGRAGWAMSPYNFFCPDPDRPGHHIIFIWELQKIIIWWEKLIIYGGMPCLWPKQQCGSPIRGPWTQPAEHIRCSSSESQAR